MFQRLDGGGAALQSTDGVARVVLSAHGLVAHVTYPLLYARHALLPPPHSGAATAATFAFDYMWQTSTFSADACPARWAFPVALLAEVVHGGPAGHAAAAAAAASDADAPAFTTPPATAAAAAGGGTDDAASCEASAATTLPVSSTAFARGAPALWVDEGPPDPGPEAEVESWWASASLRGYPAREEPRQHSRVRAGARRPVVEHVPGVVAWVRGGPRRGGAPGAAAAAAAEAVGAAEAVWAVAALDDGSALVTTQGGRYVLHVMDAPGGAAAATMYRADAVPERVNGADDGSGGGGGGGGGGALPERVPLGLYAARLFALRAAAAGVPTGASSGGRGMSGGGDGDTASTSTSGGGGSGGGGYSSSHPDGVGGNADGALWAVESADVVEESAEADGGGARFTAYADGRVRVCFADRTLLELSRDHSTARLLLRDGERVDAGAYTRPLFGSM